jgi:hypothetical protein
LFVAGESTRAPWGNTTISTPQRFFKSFSLYKTANIEKICVKLTNRVDITSLRITDFPLSLSCYKDEPMHAVVKALAASLSVAQTHLVLFPVQRYICIVRLNLSQFLSFPGRSFVYYLQQWSIQN